jgi:type IV pilus assembly protein PilM
MRAVSLRRHGKMTSLTGGRLLGMEAGVLVPAFRSPNIKEIDRFIDNLHELLDPLAGGEERISLALPEQCGIIMLEEIEAVLKSKSEGIDVLKWQLREKLPENVELQLDYQVLSRDETGRQKVLVVGMASDVIQQYEEVLDQAGYGAELIGFRSMALHNYYCTRVEMGENFVLIQAEDESLGFHVYQNSTLIFHRSRVVGDAVENIYREINRSLAGESSNLSGLNRATVYLHSNRENPEELLAALGSLFVNEPVLLKPAVEKMSSESLVLNESQSCSLSTAIGAAERLI